MDRIESILRSLQDDVRRLRARPDAPEVLTKERAAQLVGGPKALAKMIAAGEIYVFSVSAHGAIGVPKSEVDRALASKAKQVRPPKPKRR